MRQETTSWASGVLGNTQAQNTPIATISNLIPGRYRLWGNVRHSLADGVKITGPTPAIVLAGGPGDTVSVGPVVFDLTAVTSVAAVLNTATGASDTAGATIYVEKISH